MNVTRNDNLTRDIVREHPDLYALSYSPHIIWDNIQNNLNKPWNWYAISMNPNITME